MRHTFSVSVYVQTFWYPYPSSRVLLIEHKRHGLWLPLGGERKDDETPIETAKRKLREEAGWKDVRFPFIVGNLLGSPLGLLGYEEHESGERGLHMNFVFVAEISSLLIPTSDGSWMNYAWVNPALPSDYNASPPNVREVLQRLSTR